ncbi:MAG: hypothetical protein WBO55_11715 [Rhizobiaceae bacterium]
MESNEPRSIRIDADVSGFRDAMNDMENLTRRFASTFSSSFRDAALAGKDLDDVLRSVLLRFSDLALDKAFAPLDNLLSNMLSGIAGAGGAAPGAGQSPTNVYFNVRSPDAASFARSSTQITSLLARTVSRGTRSL